MKPTNRVLLLVLGVLAIVVVLFAGLLPLPGQRDNVTVHNQPAPAGRSPEPTQPKGPPADQGTVPPQQPR